MPEIILKLKDDEVWEVIDIGQEVIDRHDKIMARFDKIEKTQQQMIPLLKALLDAINKTQNKIDSQDNWWLRCTYAEVGQAQGCWPQRFLQMRHMRDRQTLVRDARGALYRAYQNSN